jgi:hypothetical protein
MRMSIAVVLAAGCAFGCGRASEKVTREQCAAVADHIATVIMNHFSSHPDELWAGMAEPYATGIPTTVTKESFAQFLASPEGKTWVMQRHGQVRSSAEAGIEPCVQVATPELVRCLLATKTREDVTACDKKYPPPAAGSDNTMPAPANPK